MQVAEGEAQRRSVEQSVQEWGQKLVQEWQSVEQLVQEWGQKLERAWGPVGQSVWESGQATEKQQQQLIKQTNGTIIIYHHHTRTHTHTQARPAKEESVLPAERAKW